MNTEATPQRRTRWQRLVAMSLSGIFPGLGQLYNGDRWKAAVFFVAGALAAFGPLNPLEVDIDLNDLAGGLRRVLLASLPFLVIALWSVVDAGRTTRGPVVRDNALRGGSSGHS